MKAKASIHTVEMVRRIRDEQAALLAAKDQAAVLEFFRQAGEAAKEDARKRGRDEGACGNASNPLLQPTGSALD